MSTLLIFVLIIVLLAVISAWPYSRPWGYGPTGILATIPLIVLVLALLGRI